MKAILMTVAMVALLTGVAVADMDVPPRQGPGVVPVAGTSSPEARLPQAP